MFAMPAAGWQWQRNIFASPPKSKAETIESSLLLERAKGLCSIPKGCEDRLSGRVRTSILHEEEQTNGYVRNPNRYKFKKKEDLL
jgi:hypothetical protein